MKESRASHLNRDAWLPACAILASPESVCSEDSGIGVYKEAEQAVEASLNARGGSGGARDEYSGGLISHYAGEYPI